MRLLTALVAAALLAAGCGGDGGGGDEAERPPADERTTTTPADAGPEAAQGASTGVPELYRRLEPSVVSVQVRGQRGAGEGSGVVLEARQVVTNHHVIAGGEEIVVILATGERLRASLIASDPRTDLALLEVPRDLPPAELAESVPPVGSLAVAIGNPLGFESSVTAGIVSGVDRAIPSGGQTPALVNLVQTDAAISPGNSGGALVGADGKVIGINVAYIPPAARAVSIGFAIPAPTVRSIVEELAGDGRVEHPYLGAQLRPLTPETAQALGVDAEQGALVAAVGGGTPAAEAGLRPGDLLVRIGDREVATVEDVLAELRGRRPGDRLELEVLRDGERQTLELRLGTRPSEPASG